MTVFTGVVGYGLYGLRRRQIPLSMYLMQLRVASQGLCIGVLSLGLAYTLGKRVYGLATGKDATAAGTIAASSKEPH